MRGVIRFCLIAGIFAPALVHQRAGHQTGILTNRCLDGFGGVGVLLEELFGVLATLANALAVIGEPGAGFLDDAGLNAEIDQLARSSKRLRRT